MECFVCGSNAVAGTTTDVTDLGDFLIVVRNVPCLECTECLEVIYTGDVITRLEGIEDEVTESMKISPKVAEDISVHDYNKIVA